MFTITQGKGFRVTFANGWSVSVQWGPGNYCEHYNGDIGEFYTRPKPDFHSSRDAEVAVFTPAGNFQPIDGCDVTSRCTPELVAEIMYVAATDPSVWVDAKPTTWREQQKENAE